MFLVLNSICKIAFWERITNIGTQQSKKTFFRCRSFYLCIYVFETAFLDHTPIGKRSSIRIIIKIQTCVIVKRYSAFVVSWISK
jgi:hypothetical protein